MWGKQGCAYEDVMHVPLTVRLSAQREGELSDARVSLVDVMPTILAVTGCPPADGPAMDGRDLRQSRQDGGYGFVFTEANGFIGVTDGRWKYVHFTRGGESLCELYDLEADPHEYTNLAHDPGSAAPLARMRGAVIEHLAVQGLQAH